jgi:hypothetical protein
VAPEPCQGSESRSLAQLWEENVDLLADYSFTWIFNIRCFVNTHCRTARNGQQNNKVIFVLIEKHFGFIFIVFNFICFASCYVVIKTKERIHNGESSCDLHVQLKVKNKLQHLTMNIRIYALRK